MKLGYFLWCEEFGPGELVAQARAAEEAGFQGLWISDHYHPWNHEQGQSPFVWSVIGALAGAGVRLPVATAVTCPTMRIHPVVIAQAAATSAVSLEGRFSFGVGTGEALNEHVLATHWPEADVRLEMLEEAMDVIRALWTGQTVSHSGEHYRVEHAKLFTLPEKPPPILVSGFGPKAVDLAARIGDGYVTTMPDAELIERFRAGGGEGKPIQAGTKVCYDKDAARCAQSDTPVLGSPPSPGHRPEPHRGERDNECGDTHHHQDASESAGIVPST